MREKVPVSLKVVDLCRQGRRFAGARTALMTCVSGAMVCSKVAKSDCVNCCCWVRNEVGQRPFPGMPADCARFRRGEGKRTSAIVEFDLL